MSETAGLPAQMDAEDGRDGDGPSWLGQAIRFTLAGVAFGLLYKYLSDLLDADPDAKTLRMAALCSVFFPFVYWFTTAVATRVASLFFTIALTVGMALLYVVAEMRFGWTIAESNVVAVWSGCAAAIAVIIIPFFRTVVERGQSFTHYPSLFEFSWNTVLMFVLAWVFTGVFWLILFFWAQLFEILNVGFFSDFFFDSWFAWPATIGAFATGAGILRTSEDIIARVRGVVFPLLHVLGPILSMATLLFVAALPFTGMAPLWELSSPAGFMISVGLAALVLINAVIGDGMGDVAHGASAPFVRLMARLQGLLLPVFVGVAAFAIWQRAGQEGLKLMDIYAGLVLGVLGLHAVVYAVAALLPGWETLIRTGNTIIALVTVLIAVLILTPLFNPEHMAARSAYARLKAGEIETRQFNFGQLQFRYGLAGRSVLAEIEGDTSLANREIIEAELGFVRAADDYYLWQQDWIQRRNGTSDPVPVDNVEDYVTLHPAGSELDPALSDMLAAGVGGFSTCVSPREGEVSSCHLYAADLNGDAREDFALFVLDRTEDGSATLWTNYFIRRADGTLQKLNTSYTAYDDGQAIEDLLANTEVTFAPHPLRLPVIDGGYVPVLPDAEWIKEQSLTAP